MCMIHEEHRDPKTLGSCTRNFRCEIEEISLSTKRISMFWQASALFAQVRLKLFSQRQKHIHVASKWLARLFVKTDIQERFVLLSLELIVNIFLISVVQLNWR